MIGAEQFARMQRGRGLHQHRARRCCTTPTRSPQSLADGHLGGAGLDHFVGEHLAVDHPLCSMRERRAHPAHRRRDLRHRDQPHDADRRRAAVGCSTAAARQPRQPGGPEVSDAAPPTSGRRGEGATARDGARRCSRRASSRAPPATSPRACPTATWCSRRRRSTTSTMELDDLVVCNLDGEVVEGHRSPTTEKMLHLSAMRRYPEINATMHCHAKHCTMFALTRQPIPAVIEEFVVYVGGDVPVADYETTGTDDARRRGRGLGRRPQRGAHGQPRPVRGGQEPGRRAAHRRAGRAHRRDRVGRAAPRRDRAPARGDQQQFAGYYRYGRTGKFAERV